MFIYKNATMPQIYNHLLLFYKEKLRFSIFLETRKCYTLYDHDRKVE